MINCRLGRNHTPVKLACLIAACTSLGCGAARAEDAQVLLHKYDCNICHADTTTKTGPAYTSIAARYRGDPNAEAKLAAVVKKGQHGAGPWHMPPHPELSYVQARTMVRYILSLKD